jgi:SulP family sulfate permease
MHPLLIRYLPVLSWARRYRRSDLAADSLAALLVTAVLIPQSLAYALLAGLSPEVGLYASVAPLLLYCVFGSSTTLAVGPVAIISLLTATTIGGLGIEDAEQRHTAAIALAALSGLMLVSMGLLRLGAIADFLSHPVIAGFITAAGLFIALGQLGPLLGIAVHGESLPELVHSFSIALPTFSQSTALLGVGTLTALLLLRSAGPKLLRQLGANDALANLLTRMGPAAAVIITTVLAAQLSLSERGVAVVGSVPASLPPFTLAGFDLGLWRQIFVSALMISLIGFVESISVARTFAAKRRERVDPDQELVGLGAANLGAALNAGMPVTGGLSRTVVNVEAGAATPAAGAFTALGILLVTVALTPLLANLPKATLGAVIIVASLSLMDLRGLMRTWRYSRADGAAMGVTMGLTLLAGVEVGLISGVLLSLALFLQHRSRPHSAVVGIVPSKQYFRNVNRHAVVTAPHLLTLRIDASLYFANARYLESRVLTLLAGHPQVTDFVLMCSAVNEIDASALHTLEELNTAMKAQDVRLHLSEIKGPVMDRLERSDLLQHLTGQVFTSQYDAWLTLAGEEAIARGEATTSGSTEDKD